MSKPNHNVTISLNMALRMLRNAQEWISEGVNGKPTPTQRAQLRKAGKKIAGAQTDLKQAL